MQSTTPIVVQHRRWRMRARCRLTGATACKRRFARHHVGLHETRARNDYGRARQRSQTHVPLRRAVVRKPCAPHERPRHAAETETAMQRRHDRLAIAGFERGGLRVDGHVVRGVRCAIEREPAHQAPVTRHRQNESTRHRQCHARTQTRPLAAGPPDPARRARHRDNGPARHGEHRYGEARVVQVEHRLDGRHMNAPRRIQESTAKQQCHRRRAGRPKARAWLRHLRSHGNRKRSRNDAAEKTALSFEERYGKTPAQCGAVHAGNSSALCVTVPCTRQAIGIARRVNVILKKTEAFGVATRYGIQITTLGVSTAARPAPKSRRSDCRGR
ncbi:hypothetical protein LMG16407_03167 [Pandoraea apista]|nr:hypothetical protein LMG16407_03167 [Pandoraea apista]